VGGNLLQQKTTLKRGIKAKRRKAGWDRGQPLKILDANPSNSRSDGTIALATLVEQFDMKGGASRQEWPFDNLRLLAERKHFIMQESFKG
jgi:hypothetical protein